MSYLASHSGWSNSLPNKSFSGSSHNAGKDKTVHSSGSVERASAIISSSDHRVLQIIIAPSGSKRE